MLVDTIRAAKVSQSYKALLKEKAKNEFEAWVKRAMPQATGVYYDKCAASVVCHQGGTNILVSSTNPGRIRKQYSSGTLCKACTSKCHKRLERTPQ